MESITKRLKYACSSLFREGTESDFEVFRDLSLKAAMLCQMENDNTDSHKYIMESLRK